MTNFRPIFPIRICCRKIVSVTLMWTNFFSQSLLNFKSVPNRQKINDFLNACVVNVFNLKIVIASSPVPFLFIRCFVKIERRVLWYSRPRTTYIHGLRTDFNGVQSVGLLFAYIRRFLSFFYNQRELEC